MAVLNTTKNTDIPEFFQHVANIIEQARKFVGKTADLTMSVTYFEVGRMIVENEQGGQERAEYGQNLIKKLSEYLNRVGDRSLFGRSSSHTTVRTVRYTAVQQVPCNISNRLARSRSSSYRLSRLGNPSSSK